MNFTLETFLKPLSYSRTSRSEGSQPELLDHVIRIYYSDGTLYNSINPFSIIRTYVSNNLIKINLNKNQILTINLVTTDDARNGLEKLQAQIDILKQRAPVVVDKKIEKQIQALKDVVSRIVVQGPSNVVTLSAGITSDKILTVAINGIAIHDWTIVGTSLTINNIPYELDSDDSIIIEYNRPV